MEKSAQCLGDRPDWYRGLQTKTFGDYFGSFASLANNETYLTHDHKYIVHCNHDVGITVRRNACLHAGAALLSVPGVQDVSLIRCPIHKWVYSPSGELIHSPQFLRCEGVTLVAPQFGVWNGYVLGYTQDEIDSVFAGFGTSLGISERCFNPHQFMFMGEEEYALPYPRQLMMINYLDGYHVPLCHQKTFGAVADCDSYKWEFGAIDEVDRVSYSVQQVRARSDVQKLLKQFMGTHNCEAEVFGWADFHVWLREKMPHVTTTIDRDIFALWAALYGNGYCMLELFEGGLFLAVSYLVSKTGTDSETENLNLVEYYVHKNVPEELRTMAMRKFRHAYEQSAREDDEICLKLWESHRLGDLDFKRMYHEVLEAGDVHWRNWCKKHFVV